MTRERKKMQFIVLEGLDGSGKSTQLEKLTRYLDNRGLKHQYIHFPRTGSPVYGELVAKFLRGELGDINEVNPYLVALIYAGDRDNAKKQVRSWIDEGYLIIADRYVYSNMAFQCAKFKEAEKRTALRDWIEKTEFSYFNIPRPDISIFMDVPLSFTKKQLKNERQGEDRAYLNGKQDIHETSIHFQEKVREVYLSLCQHYPDFVHLECTDGDGYMREAGAIHQALVNILEKESF